MTASYVPMKQIFLVVAAAFLFLPSASAFFGHFDSLFNDPFFHRRPVHRPEGMRQRAYMPLQCHQAMQLPTLESSRFTLDSPAEGVYVVQANLPGVLARDISVQPRADEFSVTATRYPPRGCERFGLKPDRMQKVFRVPADAVASSLKAKLSRDGNLQIIFVRKATENYVHPGKHTRGDADPAAVDVNAHRRTDPADHEPEPGEPDVSEEDLARVLSQAERSLAGDNAAGTQEDSPPALSHDDSDNMDAHGDPLWYHIPMPSA